ncbi:MAG: acyl-CoA dehydrogenase family protein [Pirellulales bacterium]|nr:acyl-CoA dehydrogenase family protein [Pirellulales bacterium]
MNFFQDPPQLGNQFEEDRLLRAILQRSVPAADRSEIEADLRRFGARVLKDIAELADDANTHPPQLVPYDPWGHRIDRIDVSHGWKQLERISAEEGLVAIGYERRHGAASRLHQFAKLYLFSPSSAVYTCPLAMTDGAARLIEVHGDAELKSGPYSRLTSRDPEKFWTSGQWMTERTGGSDVSQSETLARHAGHHYTLHGVKWFTSATTSQMAMTLARVVSPDGSQVDGSRGLSLFYLETRDAAGRLNKIALHRLKDKLGTKAVPTAELTLDGTPARLVGAQGRGVPNIAVLMNVTRVYNAVSSVSTMRRGIALARDYAQRRIAFGKPLAKQPLHLETLAGLEVEFAAGLHLVFKAVELLGREECGEATAHETAVLRLLTPLAKLYTAKQSVAVTSEILELFGGAGYIEDTGLPRLLRDTQVTPIWEGTTNVLSLDVLRAIERDDALGPFLEDIVRRVERSAAPELNEEVATVRRALDDIRGHLPRALSEGLDCVQASARGFAYSLARTYMASLLIEHAAWSLAEKNERRDLLAARWWCRQSLAPILDADDAHRAAARALALDEPLETSATESVSARPKGALAR